MRERDGYPADSVRVDEPTLTAIEGHFMSRGLHVVSSAITGRVVDSAVARGQVEGAAKLPALEKALVLAKDAKAECVFYLLGLEIGTSDLIRYFVWAPSGRELLEVTRQVYEGAPPDRKWFVGGPLWTIEGKVVDVDNGSVLSIVMLKHSTPFATNRQMRAEYVDRSLIPQNQYYGWRLACSGDLDILRTAIMSRLAIEVRGPQ